MSEGSQASHQPHSALLGDSKKYLQKIFYTLSSIAAAAAAIYLRFLAIIRFRHR